MFSQGIRTEYMAQAPPTVSTSFDWTPWPLASAVSAAAAEVCAPQCGASNQSFSHLVKPATLGLIAIAIIVVGVLCGRQWFVDGEAVAPNSSTQAVVPESKQDSVEIHNAQPSSTLTPVNPDLSATRFGEEPQFVDGITPGLDEQPSSVQNHRGHTRGEIQPLAHQLGLRSES